MKVFVSGATGFIGRATCRALAAVGHEVTGLARTRDKARALESDWVRAIVGTLDDPDSYLGAAGRPEVVVHLAATWISGQETIEGGASRLPRRGRLQVLHHDPRTVGVGDRLSH